MVWLNFEKVKYPVKRKPYRKRSSKKLNKCNESRTEFKNEHGQRRHNKQNKNIYIQPKQTIKSTFLNQSKLKKKK
jgi:hypothetical protein